jgi:ferredoxin
MRSLQMGLERKLETSIEPWLCYYCGQCSTQCPREAEPGETMMSIRRWLISRYDITGIARLLFRSHKTEIIFIIVTALITGLGFSLVNLGQRDLRIYDGPGAFLPSSFMHYFDLGLAIVVGSLILINAGRMWWFTMWKDQDKKIGLWLYIKYIYLLPWHFFTQKRYAECEDKKSRLMNMPWLTHLGLMLGYVTMLVLVMGFIMNLQSGPQVDWRVHVFGYMASLGLVVGIIYFIGSRLKKNQAQFKKTHGSDWVFIILLMLVVTTGILQHLLHRTGLIVAANVTYVVHLMFVVPWLLTMPVSKIMHMFYRPLAMYFADIKLEIIKARQKQEQPEIEYAI